MFNTTEKTAVATLLFVQDNTNMRANVFALMNTLTVENIVALESQNESDTIWPSMLAALDNVVKSAAKRENSAIMLQYAESMKNTVRGTSENIDAMRKAFRQEHVRFELTETDKANTFKVEKKTSVARVHILPKIDKKGNVKESYGFNLSTYDFLFAAEKFRRLSSFSGNEFAKALDEFYATNNLLNLNSKERMFCIRSVAKRDARYNYRKDKLLFDNPDEEILYLTFCDESVFADYYKACEKRTTEMKKKA